MRQQDITLLSEVYKDCQIIINSLTEFNPKADQLSMLTAVNGYSKDLARIQQKVLELSTRANESIDQTRIMNSIISDGKTKMNSPRDHSDEYIVNKVINGSTMSITNIQGFLTGDQEYDKEAAQIAEAIIALEEINIQKMKNYV